MSETEHGPRIMFSQTLANMTRGHVDAFLTDEMGELVKAIMETHKGGEITLKLKLKPEIAAHEVQAITITPEVSKKMPSEKQVPAMFYPSHDGELHRNDPRQRLIPGVQPVDERRTTRAPMTVDADQDDRPARVDIDG